MIIYILYGFIQYLSLIGKIRENNKQLETLFNLAFLKKILFFFINLNKIQNLKLKK
jgi:hypothetical protein